jgi:enolase-phosphatase E1
LKALQGHLWRAGFESGALRAPLFADVRPALEAWSGTEGKKRLAVFSSGSVAAQRLFLAHTGVVDEDGGDGVDVSGLFGGWLFDTVNAGPKTEAASYGVIARALAVAEADVLFLSDNVRGSFLVRASTSLLTWRQRSAQRGRRE